MCGLLKTSPCSYPPYTCIAVDVGSFLGYQMSSSADMAAMTTATTFCVTTKVLCRLRAYMTQEAALTRLTTVRPTGISLASFRRMTSRWQGTRQGRAGQGSAGQGRGGEGAGREGGGKAGHKAEQTKAEHQAKGQAAMR